MSAEERGAERAGDEIDTPTLIKAQIRRYALVYALIGATALYFGLGGKMKNPPPPWVVTAIGIGGALLLLLAAGLLGRARWALPLALIVHAAATIFVVVSLCIQLSDATDGTERSRILLRHAGAVVAFVTSVLFWRRADVRAWLRSEARAQPDAG
jgi:hypothetical protein